MPFFFFKALAFFIYLFILFLVPVFLFGLRGSHGSLWQVALAENVARSWSFQKERSQLHGWSPLHWSTHTDTQYCAINTNTVVLRVHWLLCNNVYSAFFSGGAYLILQSFKKYQRTRTPPTCSVPHGQFSEWVLPLQVRTVRCCGELYKRLALCWLTPLSSLSQRCFFWSVWKLRPVFGLTSVTIAIGVITRWSPRRWPIGP